MHRSLLRLVTAAGVVAASLLSGCLSDDALLIQCERDDDCEPGASCVYRVCLRDDETIIVPGEACEDDLTPCGDECVDLTSDPSHCGRCGELCEDAEQQTARCVSGSCVRTCAPGYRDLDGRPGCEQACETVQDETCNGVDDDCDGSVDDDIAPMPCPLQDGVCEGAAAPCEDGAFEVCEAGAYAAHAAPLLWEQVEATCDDADNDCDGETDEGCCPDGNSDDVLVSALDGWRVHALAPAPRGWSVLASRADAQGIDVLGAWTVREGATAVGEQVQACAGPGSLISAGYDDGWWTVCDVDGSATVFTGMPGDELEALATERDWRVDDADVAWRDARLVAAMRGEGDRGAELLLVDVFADLTPTVRRVVSDDGAALTSPVVVWHDDRPTLVALGERGDVLHVELSGRAAGEEGEGHTLALSGAGSGRLAAIATEDGIEVVIARLSGPTEAVSLTPDGEGWAAATTLLAPEGARDVSMVDQTPLSVAVSTDEAIVAWELASPQATWRVPIDPAEVVAGSWQATVWGGGLLWAGPRTASLRLDRYDRAGAPWCGEVSGP